MFLNSLEGLNVFQADIPKLPMGKYAHIITLRETNSFALFQTDGELNISRVSLGRKEQNYVLPHVYCPSVVTIKDPTEAEFIYVLNNVLRTKRYGAQNTRTGTVENHVTAIVFSDGEVFSNLQLTQAIYDILSPEHRAKTPLPQAAVLGAMESAVQTLLGEDGLVAQLYSGERLDALLHETLQITSDEDCLTAVLQQANAEANRYAQVHGVGAKEAKAKK